MTAALRLATPPDWTAEAVAALGLCAVAFDGRDLVWRSDAFAACFSDLTEGASVETVDARLPGLAQALTTARSAGTATALIVQPGGKRVHDARLARSGDRIFVELSDAAERQEAQQRHLADREELLLTSRVLSVGEMATMIAHELNQPIGSIANILRGLKTRLERDTLTKEVGTEALERATEQALYASGVIQRVRTFVDQRQPQVQRLDLARLAGNTLDLLDWEITRDRVTARADSPADLPHRQLTIAAREIAETRQIELTLTDTGPGIPQDAAGRVFSPFFSTRSGGMGVGLGICRSIIELHRGRLWFSPAPEGGSVFHIALPLAAPEEVSI